MKLNHLVVACVLAVSTSYSVVACEVEVEATNNGRNVLKRTRSAAEIDVVESLCQLKLSDDNPLITEAVAGDEASQAKLVQKYVDGTLGLTVQQLKDLNIDVVKWKILPKALADDNYAFLALDLCRFGILPTNVFENKNRNIIININRRATVNDSAQAFYNLGYIYLYGISQPQSSKFALEFLLKAAEGKYLQSRLLLALIHEHGINVEKNEMAAMYWYSSAIDLGSDYARNELDRLMSENGYDD